MLSKLGLASRTQAAQWIREGRVRIGGRLVRDPEFPVASPFPDIRIDAQPIAAAERIYLALNKPRGLVTTAADERGRDTVYACLAEASLPWVAPVGRLDKASEGLLLMTNDPAWADRVTHPDTGPAKTYHVQVDGLPDDERLRLIEAGTLVDGERLRASQVARLRQGGRNSWLEIVLEEGRNRQIRRLLAAFDLAVLRLVRVAIGPVALGDLAKGQWRHLTVEEVAALADPTPRD